MGHQIFDIAATAGQVLLHPATVVVPLLTVAALVTGLAGRMALFIEDLRQMPSESRDVDHAPSSPIR